MLREQSQLRNGHRPFVTTGKGGNIVQRLKKTKDAFECSENPLFKSSAQSGPKAASLSAPMPLFISC